MSTDLRDYLAAADSTLDTAAADAVTEENAQAKQYVADAKDDIKNAVRYYTEVFPIIP